MYDVRYGSARLGQQLAAKLLLVGMYQMSHGVCSMSDLTSSAHVIRQNRDTHMHFAPLAKFGDLSHSL